jgi:hypothetical protein
VQTTTNSRWGDYTSMNVDGRRLHLWYVNEYYKESGAPLPQFLRPTQAVAGAIASFKLPNCS